MKHFGRILLGYLAAVITASSILVISSYVNSPLEHNVRDLPAAFVALCLWAFLLSVLPGGLLIWAAERLRVRALWVHCLGGALVGGLAIAFLSTDAHAKGLDVRVVAWWVVAGITAALPYWRIAGRHAGSPQ